MPDDLYDLDWSMEFDKPNHNGRVYPKDEMLKALNEFMEKDVRPVVTSFEGFNMETPVPIEKICGNVEEYEVDDNTVKFKCKINNTEQGKMIKKLLNSPATFSLSQSGVGRVCEEDDNVVVRDFELASFAPIDKNDLDK